MTQPSHHETTSAITGLLNRLFFNLDERRYQEAAELFGSDGTWLRQGKLLAGAAQVQEALEQRPAGTTTRHLISNTIVDGEDGAVQDSVHYIAVYAGKDDGTLLALDSLQPAQIGVYRARCRHTEAGWRIVELTADITFRRKVPH